MTESEEREPVRAHDAAHQAPGDVADEAPPAARFPSRTRTLLMGQVPFSLPEAQAATLVRVPAIQIAEPGPDSGGVRRALDEISVDIDLRRGAREILRELSSLSTTALHDRIAVASDETLDCYLESLREHEGIEVTDGRSAVVASATSTPPEPPAPSETTRPTEPSAFNRPRWSRTLRIPPVLEPATPARASRAQAPRAPARSRRRAVTLFASSLVTGAVMAAIGFGFTGVAAAPSEALRARGSTAAQALDEQPEATEAAAAVEEPALADEAPAAAATAANPAASPAPAVAAAPERSGAASAAAPVVAPTRAAAASAVSPPPAPAANAAAATTIEDATERGVLSIYADPDEAVYLNGRLVGWGPIVRLEVDAHSYEVTVQRDGGEQSQFVDVRAGGDSTVRVSRFAR
jgi:hypothetical protein